MTSGLVVEAGTGGLTMDGLPTMVGAVPVRGEVRLTDVEITAACIRLGLPRPLTLPAGASPPEGEGPGMAAAPPDGEGLPAWTADLLETLARPHTVAFLHCREKGSPARIKVCVVARPWAVEQVPEAGGTYALSLIDAADVTTRLIAFTGLSDRGEIPACRLEISGSAFLSAMERAPSDLDGTCGLLRADGLMASDARLLAAALAGCQRLAQVTVLERPTATLLEGVSVGWFDAGTCGLWQVIAPKLAIAGDYGDIGEALLDQTLVAVSPTTDKALLEEIERGFGLSEPE